MRILAAVIAIAAGLLVLAGYFFPEISVLVTIQTLLLNWALLMLAAATLVGALNLAAVHTNKIRRREKGNLYSAVLLVFLFGVFMLGLIFKPGHEVMRLLLNGLLLPVEASLMAVLAVTLLYAGVRLLRRRADFTSLIFVATAALILLGSATLPFGNIPVVTSISLWVKQVLAVGGARGILIGVALGSLLTGLRVLFGADRPYGGN
ncbi:MAG: hypothetical protein IT310_02610 [Anaerolineales bacterium]|nr:hypothetical protein [Anaerolineales bacterium]